MNISYTCIFVYMHKSKERCSVLIKEKLMELRRNRGDIVRVGVEKIKI